MSSLFNILSWPLWVQAPGVVIGLWGLWKTLTLPYWGPAQ